MKLQLSHNALRVSTMLALVLLLFTRCNKNSSSNMPAKEKEPVPARAPGTANAAVTDSVIAPLSSLAAIENGKDSTHLFIRTADVKFKVKDVASATYQVEDAVRHLGGYVTYTTLTSNMDEKTDIPVSADSLLQTTYYTVQNSMVIRVPNTNLDSALIAIAPLVTYLDYRNIKANDAGMQILANHLMQARIARYQNRMNSAIDAGGKKLTETNTVADAQLDKQEQADNAMLDNLSLKDQVKFSTINLSLYQPQTAQHLLVYNDKSISPYQPPLTAQFTEAVKFGWNLLTGLLLAMLRLWPIIIAGIAGIIIYRRRKLRIA